MRMRHLLVSLAILAIATSGFAYLEPVHRILSVKAFDRTSADFKGHLGIDRAALLDGQQLRAIVAQAAEDEDDQDPLPVVDFSARALNHFFDPTSFGPFSALRVPISACAPVGESAQHWCIDGTGNSYSLRSAHESYAAALMAPNNATRDVYLKDLIASLGHQIHLVQDMAQPEHTRNDQHLPGSEAILGNGTTASLYEEWSVINLLGLNPAVSYDGYPNVVLARSQDYFADDGGNGLAQFANRAFVTQDTNYDDEKVPGKCVTFKEPVFGAAIERVEVVNEAVRDAFGGVTILPILEHVYTARPEDKYLSTPVEDVGHTFLSSLDLETRMLTGPKFSLGDLSMLTRASILIPRAVGYSAGYLDHFFRGKIDVIWRRNPAGGGFDVKVTNLSAEAIGADARIRALYAPGSAYLGLPAGSDTGVILSDYLSTLVPGFNGLASGASVTIPNVSVPYLHAGDDVHRFERRIVITGTLGSEPSDVIGLVQPGYGKGLVFEATWDGTFFASSVLYAHEDHYQHTQACGPPCANPPGVPDTTVLTEGLGLLAIGVDPITPGRLYDWQVTHSQRTDKQFHAVVYRDGVPTYDQVITIPGCTTVGYCYTYVEVGTFPQ